MLRTFKRSTVSSVALFLVCQLAFQIFSIHVSHSLTCVSTLLRVYCVRILAGASVDVLMNKSDVLQRIFFQDQEMKDIFSAYPELVCVDATYKLLELRFPVYVMLIEDGNGLSEVIAVFLLLEETAESISAMVSIFKKHNSNWNSVRVVMADKDMTERNVFASAFPQAKLLICLYHGYI